MEEQAARDELALPGAAAALSRLAAALDLEPAAVLTRLSPEQRARALAEALLEGIAAGRCWDEAWYSGDEPAVADDHLVAELLAAAASLMHLGAEVAGVEPQQFLRDALGRVPPQA